MRTSLARAIELYKYFPFGTATALTIVEAARAILAPDGRLSYAQTGEDRIIQSYIDVSRPGFYVDVGCHHPFEKSNTLELYSRGWRGLAIDGNAELIKLFGRLRPRDTAICAIVSNEEREVTFTIAEQAELSTISAAFERSFIRESGVRERVRINAVKLQTIMENHGVPTRFDLLSIDVEGHDFEALTSFDINVYRPRVIVIEMHGYDIGGSDDHPIRRYLEREHYKLRSYSVMNGIFIDTKG